jgi:metal-sulfur cluster biosynthetic enzyme
VQVREALMAVPGVSDAEVEVVWDPPWDPSRMSDEARLSLNMY